MTAQQLVGFVLCESCGQHRELVTVTFGDGAEFVVCTHCAQVEQ